MRPSDHLNQVNGSQNLDYRLGFLRGVDWEQRRRQVAARRTWDEQEYRALQAEVCGPFNPNVAYGVKEKR